MKKIKMFGAIVDEFGMSEIEIDAHSKVDALKALDMNLPGFIKYVDEHGYIVVLLDPDSVDVDNPKNDAAEQFTLDSAGNPWGDEVMYIVPTAEGDISAAILGAAIGGAGAGSAITVAGVVVAIGVNSAVASVIVAVANIAIVMAVSAVISVISNAITGEKKEADEEANYLFTGAINTSKQGGRMPLLFGGPMMCGSMVLSGRIVSKEGDLDVTWAEAMKLENPNWKIEHLASGGV